MADKKQREYLTAVSIDKGIITLVEPDGRIGWYRQRGINRIEPAERERLIKLGALDSRWQQAKELPSNWSISFEDEEIMGKARATFPGVSSKKRS
jgi:hypothetical protein